MNHVTLYGNLGADPELKRLESGSLLKLRLATTERRKVKDEWVDHTEWHQITVWGKRAEGLAEILEKGSRILVTGSIRTRSYESNGEKRYSTEIHADEIELAGKSGGKRDDDRPQRHRRPERPARAQRDDDREPASDPFEGYR